MSQPVTAESIMQIGFAFWQSKTLLSAVELGLFTELANGPIEDSVGRFRISCFELNQLIDAGKVHLSLQTVTDQIRSRRRIVFQ